MLQLAPQPVSQPPELLAQPIRERLLQFDCGAWSAAGWREQADAWSQAADTRYRACAYLRPLPVSDLPVAVGVKDTVDVAGMPTRLGLRHYRRHPVASAGVIERVRSAAINAKVVTTELNIGLGSGCRNPYLPDYDPAGSSTGAAVAVAAGICDLALGTDVLGSVRWPAGRCGVVGLRTTHDPGVLPGILPLSPSMDAVGWVARTADDLAVLWDRLGLGAGLTTERTASRPYRIGIVSEALAGSEPEIVSALKRTAEALAAGGHALTTVSVAGPWEWRGAAWELCSADAARGYRSWRQWLDDDLSESTQLALAAGDQVDDARLAEIRAAQRTQRDAVGELFSDQQVDAWLLPLDPTLPRPRSAPRTSASTIPAIDHPAYDTEVGYTALASFTGLPAITIPVGTSVAGAPLAMQLVGPRWSEPALIRLACAAAGHLALTTYQLR